MMTGWDFIMNAWDFYDLQFKIILWTIEIFTVAGLDFHFQDFYDDRPRFYYERLRFLWWKVENFIVTSEDFYYDRSRFSWWQLDI